MPLDFESLGGSAFAKPQRKGLDFKAFGGFGLRWGWCFAPVYLCVFSGLYTSV